MRLKELKNNLARKIMGELPASFYDQSGIPRLQIPLPESPWYENYVAAAELLPPIEDRPRILDLGCGPGHFGELAKQKGYPADSYLGLDYSAARIQIAQETYPYLNFRVESIYSENAQALFSQFDVFVALETLEHLQHDVKLIKSLPPDRLFIFLVPSYFSKTPRAHLRRFTCFKDIVSRYEKYLVFYTIQRLERISEAKCDYVCLAKTKSH